MSNKFLDQEIREWLCAFSECIRARDLEAGKALFVEDALGFGTRVFCAHNRADLIDSQWQPTWFRTSDFSFNLDEAVGYLSNDGNIATVAVTWTSLGVDNPERWGDQKPYPRHGRCTIVLKKTEKIGWQAIHSHFSMLSTDKCSGLKKKD